MRGVDKSDVPGVTVPRLALYLRKLRELRARGVDRVSSKDLAEMIDLNAVQIRKDFSYFGEFGTRGVGYSVQRLIDEIGHCLGLDHSWKMVIVGAGRLGTALAWYRGFSEQGFDLVAIFDSDPEKIGKKHHRTQAVRSVADLEEFCRAEQVDIALVTVPAAEAESTIQLLAAVGVRAILNFAPVKVHTDSGVLVRQVDLSSELMSLSFYLDREQG
jgi:redox-sensing transcriptional repressor